MSMLTRFEDIKTTSFESVWQSPANIAFVKYWGKVGHQIPANPSVSMTLKECYTQTRVKFSESNTLEVELYLDGKKEDRFAVKIKSYLESLARELPWILRMSFSVHTKNTFPHGTGIASSASGLSAFALCLTDYIYAQTGADESFYQVASYLSRLASGSACRSIYGGFVSWGEASLEFATPVEVHPSLMHLQDTVLVISGQEKSVSSRAGHERMKEHAFAQARFQEARINYERMSCALKAGDISEMGLILENEALQLHAMMMTSPESFILLRPNTITAIENVRAFRYETQLPLYFTLDAGPNLHLIYPEAYKNKISTFINTELRSLSETIIEDECGEGPKKCL